MVKQETDLQEKGVQGLFIRLTKGQVMSGRLQTSLWLEHKPAGSEGETNLLHEL